MRMLRAPNGPSEKSRSAGCKLGGLREEIRLFERSEFTNFSKLPRLQGFWKTGLDLLVTFGSCQK